MRSVPEPTHQTPGPSQASTRPEALARAARLVFAAGLFLVPVVFDPRTLDVFNLLKLTGLWVFGIAALGLWLYATHLDGTSRPPARSSIIRASVVLVAVTFVASLLSVERTLSFVGFYHRYEGFASLVLYVGVLLFIAALYKGRPTALREIAIAVSAASGVVAVYVVFQKAGVDFIQWHIRTAGPPPFPIGSLGNSAFTASYLGIALPFVLYLLLSSPSRAWRAVWACVGVLTVPALWFTQGRAGMSAAALGIVSFGLFSLRLRTSFKLGVIVLALLALVAAPIVAGDIDDPATEGVLRTSTAGYRAELWETSWRMVLDRPVLGSGPETYFGRYPGFRTADAANRDGLLIPDSPHNIYLSWATGTGIVGLVAFLIVVGLALTLAGRRAQAMPTSHRRITAAFAGGLAAYLGQGVYSLDVPPLVLMCWVALGGLAVLTAGTKSTPTVAGPPVTRSAPRRFGVPAVVGVLMVLLIALGLRPLRADHAAWAAARELSGQDWSDDAFALHEKAIALNPVEPAYRGMLAQYLERTASGAGGPYTQEDALLRASQLYVEAHSLQPRNIYFMLSLARVNTRLGKVESVRYFSTANRWMQRVETIDRLNPRVYDTHVNILKEWASEERGKKRREILAHAELLFALAASVR